MGRKEKKIESGIKYGLLTVLREVEPTTNYAGKKVRRVEFRCDCGSLVIKNWPSVKNDNCKSCGCLPTGRPSIYP